MDESADVSRRALMHGLAGATAVSTAAGTAAAQGEDDDGGEGGSGGGGTERPVFPDYVSDAKDAGYENLRGEDAVTIEVGADPEGLAFAPTRAWLSPGTEVTFEWVSDGHNVVSHERPDEASWEPHESLEDSGFSYSTTVETAGMHTYFCQPHEGVGMRGAFAVGGDVETETVGGESGGGPQVPDAGKSLGVAAAFAMSATLGLAYFFIKYGGNYGDVDSA